MTDEVNEITNLTELWCKLVAIDHHKDRDCHWWVETKFSYGAPPVYAVCHQGYVYEGLEIECNSYDKAIEVLKKELKKAIKQELGYIKMRATEGGWIDELYVKFYNDNPELFKQGE